MYIVKMTQGYDSYSWGAGETPEDAIADAIEDDDERDFDIEGAWEATEVIITKSAYYSVTPKDKK